MIGLLDKQGRARLRTHQCCWRGTVVFSLPVVRHAAQRRPRMGIRRLAPGGSATAMPSCAAFLVSSFRCSSDRICLRTAPERGPHAGCRIATAAAEPAAGCAHALPAVALCGPCNGPVGGAAAAGAHATAAGSPAAFTAAAAASRNRVASASTVPLPRHSLAIARRSAKELPAISSRCMRASSSR